jgi:hypothetical protein
MDLRALCILVECSTTEPHPQPNLKTVELEFIFSIVDLVYFFLAGFCADLRVVNFISKEQV